MQVFQFSNKTSCPLPLFISKVQAGFPSPAEDYADIDLDLNKHLVKHPASTFFVRVEGDSMIDAGIKDGSLLVVDKSLKPTNNKIVVAVVDGEFTVKRLKITGNGFLLVPENKKFSPIKITENSYIWGVVTSIINEL